MNIENYFEQEKGITVDAARNAGARYTAIDICRFAKKYHESEVKKFRLGAVSGRSELLLAFVEHIKKDNELTETINANDVEAFLKSQQ